MFLCSKKDLNTLEINFFARPTLEFQDECEISPLVERELYEKREDNTQPREDQTEDKCKILSSLKIKLPSLGEFEVEEDCDDEGFKTPTSSDHKVPVVLQCPPAPRKSKSRPLRKRKVSQRRILLDLSNEVEALFPPALLADLGNKIKKVRQETDTKL